MPPLSDRHGRHRPTGNPLRDGLLLGVGGAMGVAALFVAQRLFPEPVDPDVEHYLEVRRFVLDNFVEEPDREELARLALDAMFEGLDDYSDYEFDEEYERVARETSGTYIGIGVIMRAPTAEGRILYPMPGSPAEEAGLRVGDRIVEVDGEPIEGLAAEGLTDRLRGTAETTVHLLVEGLDGARREHDVRRRDVVHPTVRHPQILDRERGIGYAAILQFSRRTPEELDRTFRWLLDEGMRALVLDLRGNGGGVLVSAVQVARRFIPAGTIVSTRGRFEDIAIEADAAQATWSGFPVVLLVDQDSASASEVLAGALQDHRAGVLVGAPTRGKGMVQTIRRYPERRAIARVTSSHYYTPADRNLERSEERAYGIVPDVELALDREARGAVLAAMHGRFGAPMEAIGALRAWETAEEVELLDPPPDDAQVRAAVDLLSGRRPVGPSADEAR